MLHKKRADLGMQGQWNAFMSNLVIDDDFIADYYRTPISKIAQFHDHRLNLETRDEGAFFDRQSFNREFLAAISLTAS